MLLNILLLFLIPAGLMLALMPVLLPRLRAMKMGQTIYELGPKHQQKQGTPNMGGILIGGITAVCLIVFCLVRLSGAGLSFSVLAQGLLPLLFITLFSMAIGFADDFIKDVKKRHDGLSPKQKLIMQLAVGVVFSFWCMRICGTDILLPFTDRHFDLGIFYIPVMTLLVMFMTNSANLQDGLDGLLSTVTLFGMTAFGACVLAISGAGLADEVRSTLSIGCFALGGAVLGFLYFNHYPAKIFMGDTGSMFIGGMMAGVAMLSKCQFPMILFCFTSIVSSLSVMLQVGYFKLTHGKRLFKMSPIHHHFELCGMKEPQIVLMYAGVTILTSLLGIWMMSPYFG